MKNSNTLKISLASLLAALCVTLLFLGSVITVLDLSAAAIASIIVTYAVIELKGAYPWLIWLTASTLALLLCPDKFGAIVFFIFAGYYPILKKYIERTKIITQWILKLLVFNIALTALLLISLFIIDLNIAADAALIYIGAYIMANGAFIIFDIALTRLISFYFFKLVHRFKFPWKK